MARVAVDLCDRLILTSDNPRDEEPMDIIADMKAGLDSVQMAKTIVQPDRREAIRTACMFAGKGDIILIAGKGHETYQEIRGVKHHFSDHEEIAGIFAREIPNP
jgi:UDP-N-acetylmuramoyl-L-alanyl-D-glutamate--2,6-diaminopimelate ligase